MSRFLVDTSAYSAFFRGDSATKEAIQSCDEICLNPVVIGELLAGFRKGRQRAANEKELEEFLAAPRVKVLAIDEDTSTRYAVILEGLWSAGTPIPTNDMWLDALVLQHNLVLCARDAHFDHLPQLDRA